MLREAQALLSVAVEGRGGSGCRAALLLEDLLSGGPKAAGIGNLRSRLASALVSGGMCEEKHAVGLLFETTRYPPSWCWRESEPENGKKKAAGLTSTWTSRDVLIEGLQEFLLLPAGTMSSSSPEGSAVDGPEGAGVSGRHAALCGLAESCGLLAPAVLDVLDSEDRECADRRLGALKAEAAMGEAERWGWPAALACVMAHVSKRSSSWF